MLKELFKKWRHKVLVRPDSTMIEIKARCEATRKITGTCCNHDWQLVLIHRNGESLTEISEAAARFNTDNSGIVAFWLNADLLNSYLEKRKVNDEWFRKGVRAVDLPYAPNVLAESCACANEFSLNDITNIIKTAEKNTLEHDGELPETPSLLPYKESATPFKLYNKVFWAEK